MTEREEKFVNKEASDIALQLKTREDEWNKVLMSESMGGNAGDNKSAINAYADKKTGAIIIFGNFQDIPQDIRKNPEYGRISFLYNYGDTFMAAIERRKPENPAFFEEVYGEGITPRALDNLREAIKIYNNGSHW